MDYNDIIRVLELCISNEDNCSACPYCDRRKPLLCIEQVMLDAFNFIKRQQAENERLQGVIDSFTDIGKLHSEIKSEARKEFAERLISEKKQDWEDNWGLTQIVTIEGIEDLLEELEKGGAE